MYECLGIITNQFHKPQFVAKGYVYRFRERQSMTDRTLSISDALREAQLQRLEASLASKAAHKPQATTKPANVGDTKAND